MAMTHEPITFSVAGEFRWESLPGFIRNLHSVATAASDRYRLDLSGLSCCEPIGIACLAAGRGYLSLLEQEIVEVVRPESAELDQHLEKVGLFATMAGGDPVSIPLGDVTEFAWLSKRSEVAPVTTVIREFFATRFELAEKKKAALDTILSEIAENVFHHAHSPTGAFLACESTTDKLVVSIVDLGDGIRRRLLDTDALKQIVEKHEGPLRAAVAPSVTSRPAHNSGYGLALASGLVRQNGGTMMIYSQRDLLEQQGDETVERKVEERWPGTAIQFVVWKDGPMDVNALYNEVWPSGDDDDFDFLEDPA